MSAQHLFMAKVDTATRHGEDDDIGAAGVSEQRLHQTLTGHRPILPERL
jgi:hypothetical protein